MFNLKHLVAAFAALAVSSLGAAPRDQSMQEEVSYIHDIAPIAKNFCTTCHAGDDPEGDLLLTSYEAIRKAAEHGELLYRINDADDPMPEDGLMPAHLRRTFQKWADGGYVDQGRGPAKPSSTDYEKFTPPEITPVGIDEGGYDFLTAMPGHWVGTMNLMGTDFNWMAFDYRAIAPSHVHGIFEGGTIGNLFTSFFIADFKGEQAVMARNGGILNGIYRTSYFVLDRVKNSFLGGTSYRFVDALGGEGIMSMELTFKGEKMEFRAYTSRLGLKKPTLHMRFKGERNHPEIAKGAAQDVGFPSKVSDFTFPDPLPTPTWAADYPLTSATYLDESPDLSLVELGKRARDPRRIDQMPHLSELSVTVARTPATKGKNIMLFLSRDALTDADGNYLTGPRTQGGIRLPLLNTILSFPELGEKNNEFTFTYLHPGTYFLTAVADLDGDGLPSLGDITHAARKITLAPESTQSIHIDDLTVQN